MTQPETAVPFAPDLNADYSGRLWNELPGLIRRAAMGHPNIPTDQSVVKSICVECKHDMYTRDPNLENMCEFCESEMRSRHFTQEMKRNAGMRERGMMPTEPIDQSFIPWPRMRD